MSDEVVIKYAPIMISVFSFGIACLSLGWNIYRDVMGLKARLKVKFYIGKLVWSGHQQKTYVVMRATNFGPGELMCEMVCFKNRPLFVLSKKEYAQGIIIHDYTNSLSAQLPHKLKFGETIMLLFEYKKDIFLKDPITHIGILDSFGREHYASSADVRRTKKEFHENFFKATGSPLSRG